MIICEQAFFCGIVFSILLGTILGWNWEDVVSLCFLSCRRTTNCFPKTDWPLGNEKIKPAQIHIALNYGTPITCILGEKRGTCEYESDQVGKQVGRIMRSIQFRTNLAKK